MLRQSASTTGAGATEKKGTDAKEIKATPIFSTPTIRDKDYKFIKPTDHFNAPLSVLNDPQKKEYRKIRVCQKNSVLKKTPKHAKRNKKTWVKVTGDNLVKSLDLDDRRLTENEIRSLVHMYIIANGERRRYAVGSAPKYRSDGTSVYSEQVLGFTSYYDYIYSMPTPKTFCLEDMGRHLLHDWVHQQDDGTFDNYGIGHNQQEADPSAPVTEGCRFFAIDPARLKGEITTAFFITRKPEKNEKIIQYDMTNWKEHPEKKEIRGKPFFVYELPGRTKTYFGPLHENDYTDFPKVKHRAAMNWDWSDKYFFPITEKLQTDVRFQHEYLLQTVIEIVTRDIGSEFTRIHLADLRDQKQVNRLDDRNIKSLMKIALNKKFFATYLENLGIAAMQIILYENREFLSNNKHYQADNPEDDKKLWSSISTRIINEFCKLKAAANQPLDKKTRDSLVNFAEKIRTNDPGAFASVKSRYFEQEMVLRSANVKKALYMKFQNADVEKLNTESKTAGEFKPVVAPETVATVKIDVSAELVATLNIEVGTRDVAETKVAVSAEPVAAALPAAPAVAPLSSPAAIMSSLKQAPVTSTVVIEQHPAPKAPAAAESKATTTPAKKFESTQQSGLARLSATNTTTKKPADFFFPPIPPKTNGCVVM